MHLEEEKMVRVFYNVEDGSLIRVVLGSLFFTSNYQ